MPNGTPQTPQPPTGKPLTPPQPMRPGVPAQAAPTAPAANMAPPTINPGVSMNAPMKAPHQPGQKKGRGGLISLIIILIAVVLGAGGFAAWYYDLIPGFSRSGEETEVAAPSLSDEMNEVVTDEVSDTAITEEDIVMDDENTDGEDMTEDEYMVGDEETISTSPTISAPLSGELYDFDVLSETEYRYLRTFGAYPVNISPDELGQENLFKPFF